MNQFDIFLYFFNYFKMFILETIVLKSGPARQPGTRLTGVGPGRVEEKIEKEKTQHNPIDPARPDQKLDCNLLIFFFLPEFLHGSVRQIH